MAGDVLCGVLRCAREVGVLATSQLLKAGTYSAGLFLQRISEFFQGFDLLGCQLPGVQQTNQRGLQHFGHLQAVVRSGLAGEITVEGCRFGFGHVDPRVIQRIVGLIAVRRVFDIAPRLCGLKAGGAESKGNDKDNSVRCKRHEIPTSDE